MENQLQPNAGKNAIIEVEGNRYERLPIRTHLITNEDDIVDVAVKENAPYFRGSLENVLDEKYRKK